MSLAKQRILKTFAAFIREITNPSQEPQVTTDDHLSVPA